MNFFKIKNMRNDLWGHIATGEDLVSQAIWPIWLFTILPSYQDIGMLTTITIFITFLLMLYMGKLSDIQHKSPLVKKSALALAISWIIRMFAITPISIFFADMFYKVSTRALFIPYTALSYTRSSKNHAIEYTTFWMIALAAGKCIAAIAILIMLAFTDNLVYSFFIAALLTLLFLVWKDKIIKNKNI